MNLEFNIAVHVLCFLAQHDQEQFNSKELAKLTCLNPVQLRRVLAYLTEHNYIKVQRGKAGGYQANQHTAQVDLAKLYQHFVLDKNNSQRRFTGASDSHCQIYKKIAHTMSHYYSQEHQIILDFYKDKNITDVLADILQEG